MSIRARLVVLALLAVVPLMLDRVRLLEATRAERIDDAAAEVLALTRRGAEGQREIITTVRGMLQVMARAYVTMLARGETCNMYLKDLTASTPWLKGMAILGPDGRVKCAALSNVIGINMSDRPHYQEALKTRDFVLSKYLVGRASGTPSVIAVYPAQAIDPNVEAVMVASVDLQWISNLISSLGHRPGAAVLLIDGHGTVLSGDPQATKWIGQQIDDSELMRQIGEREEGTARARGLDGMRRIFGFVRVPESDSRLVVGLDELDVLQRVDREVLLAYLQLGFFGLFVLLIAWFGGERLIVDPIRSLVRTATRLGRGDLEARPDRKTWAKEFLPLAAALTDMAQKLADREKELRAANRHLEELASIDSLSGLANRRGFDARLAADWQRACRLKHAVALLMIDVDHFKQFNDRYGHVEGDVCLRRVGRLLKSVATDDDFPARYGGEEFALLLPGADLAKAAVVGERLRRTVEDLHIANASSPNGQVTVSVGVASFIPATGEAGGRLVEAADAALYDAKRRGRNTVVVHEAMALAAAS
jgi:diguanylate cyclase (GGDEF)-like protein